MDATDQLQTASLYGEDYIYDAEGNMATRTRISGEAANDYRTEFAWDYRNRLTQVGRQRDKGGHSTFFGGDKRGHSTFSLDGEGKG